MESFEKILEVPSCYFSRETTEKLAARIYAIAEEQANKDYEAALRQIAPSLNCSPEDAVKQYLDNTELRGRLIARKDKTTFITQRGNVQYIGRNVFYEEIPTDPNQVIIESTTNDGKHLSISLITDIGQFFPLHKANKVVMQGYNQEWVNGIYEDFYKAIESSKKILRNALYKWFRVFGCLAFFCLTFLELRIFHFIQPLFTITTPLTGIASIIFFIVLLVNFYAVFISGARVLQYLYPYFEFQDRLSEKRKDLRILWLLTVTSIYGSGIWAIVTFIF